MPVQEYKAYYDDPRYPLARWSRPPPQPNVPRYGQGPLSREYSKTVGHCTLQDETTHPWNGSRSDVSCLHVTVSTCLHPGMEQTQSIPFKQTPVGGSHRSALHRRYPAVQPSKLKKDRTPPHAAPSSPLGSFPQKPVEPRRFNLIGERKLAQQKPDLRRIGKRRALVIGINYGMHPNPKFRLKRGVEDAYSIANFLHANLGFAHEDIRIMTDEGHPWNPPTKENILREMRSLVRNALPDDSFLFYFSGHGVQIKDLDGDEDDGLDECICAVDYNGDIRSPNPDTPGIIVDDIMHQIMVKHLPLRCRLTAIFDTCHSGTMLDLPYIYDLNGVLKKSRHPNRSRVLHMKSSRADVISLGASQDNQESLETKKGGALRRAFIECMTASGSDLTYKRLIQDLRGYMKRHGFQQRPVLSSSHEIDTKSRFVI